ncbi:class A beta-lactamase-related serine hydrolase [Qipengyuania sp. XHP0207]|uniref:serine hydrolase n=1 Tax=Qipengyuania sp. XHP0207 TaxID=3038078 RepID=UPI00241EB305|nr:serine hydrolase [Qipengyuania sp. XHP0207]MDG5748317.1 class A beta-lactamase-related serine hydrolase [Qipengyuania sp. XHP0207]
MRTGFFKTIFAAGAVLLASPALANSDTQAFERSFDQALGTEVREPQSLVARYDTQLERSIAQVAEGSRGRIGVYAIDLSTGREVGILADQRFPMASTSKVAIAATYLAGVDEGKWGLTSEWRLPRPGGAYMPAYRHIALMISKSCNDCTDALLNAVGGPAAVNEWMRKAGISDFTLSRDIATLIREDGRSDPASSIDTRDSATPRAMGQLLAGIYQGKWLSESSRKVIIDAMIETTTGKRRMRSALPMSAQLANKTGTLSRTASDIGIFRTADGRTIAAAIYVTGQSPSMAVENGSRAQKLEARRLRDARISNITSALYRGFGAANDNGRAWAEAEYGGE